MSKLDEALEAIGRASQAVHAALNERKAAIAEPTNADVELVRFAPDADADTKRQFATDLIAALEEIGVKPGDSFFVTTGERVGALENQLELARDKIDDLEEDQRRVEDIDELVRDVDRGLWTWEEFKDHVGTPLVA